ncbi:MAG: hypothetical protein ABIS45_01615 [Burkholderiales bacterium]
MKRSIALSILLMLLSPVAMAYQVTGPVLEVNDTSIVVQKGTEKWEIARDKDTKANGTLKKGDKVTVQYRMTATSIEVKDAKAPAKKK